MFIRASEGIIIINRIRLVSWGQRIIFIIVELEFSSERIRGELIWKASKIYKINESNALNASNDLTLIEG